MKPNYAYEKDAAAIYRRSFAVIRSEADLARFSPIEERVAVRVIHACGMVETAADVVFSPGAAEAAREALRARSAHLLRCAHGRRGVTRARLVAQQRRDLRTPAIPPTPELASLDHDADGGTAIEALVAAA